jgi:hypothetical protein
LAFCVGPTALHDRRFLTVAVNRHQLCTGEGSAADLKAQQRPRHSSVVEMISQLLNTTGANS